VRRTSRIGESGSWIQNAQDLNPVPLAIRATGSATELSIKEHELGAVPDTIEASPFSVSIYSYPLQ
jgi:hypothetical protein